MIPDFGKGLMNPRQSLLLCVFSFNVVAFFAFAAIAVLIGVKTSQWVWIVAVSVPAAPVVATFKILRDRPAPRWSRVAVLLNVGFSLLQFLVGSAAIAVYVMERNWIFGLELLLVVAVHQMGPLGTVAVLWKYARS